MSLVKGLLLAALSLGGAAMSAVNTHKLKACSCSSGYDPSKRALIATILLALAVGAGIMLAFIGNTGVRIGLGVLTIGLMIGACVLTFGAVKPTHDDCSCGGYQAKGMTIATGIVAAVVALLGVFILV